MIQKIYTIVEEVIKESGIHLVQPVKKAAAVAVIKNPFADIYNEDLSLLYEYGETLGGILGDRVRKAIGILPEEAAEKVEGYGKAVIVGMDGELEHAHAIMHPKFGASFRSEVGGIEHCKAIMPSAAKLGVPGTKIDIPIHNKNNPWIVSSFDSMEIGIVDAPKSDEILVAVAITQYGRPLARTHGTVKASQDKANN